MIVALPMIAEQLENLINDVSEPGSINRLSSNDVGEWLREYLEMHAEDAARFPEMQHQPHWDLLMADYDRTRDAFFFCVLFQHDLATLLAGRGLCDEVRTFVEQEFEGVPQSFLDAISTRFAVGKTRITVPQSDLLAWLERS
jgi:hypothetical protein